MPESRWHLFFEVIPQSFHFVAGNPYIISHSPPLAELQNPLQAPNLCIRLPNRRPENQKSLPAGTAILPRDTDPVCEILIGFS